jgi:3-oxoacyl-[acyl-carrier protein] reductase
MDVRDHEAVDEMVARVIQEWGQVDVLVTNAGGGRGRPMDTKASTLDPAILQLVTEMNLFGTVYSCNAVAPVMKQQRSGEMITVSSVAGTAPSADGGYAHYEAAKPPSPTTRGIWRRISARSVSRPTASRRV